MGIKKRSNALITCLKFKFALYYIISFIFLYLFSKTGTKESNKFSKLNDYFLIIFMTLSYILL